MNGTDQTKHSILIVDDEPTNIRVLLEILRPLYPLRVANNGETALQIVQSDTPPDLVLLDIMMPGLDGFDVCRKIKSNPNTATIPIIFITGKDTDQDEIYGFEVGAVDYITKPFKPVVVKARVKNQLELKNNRDVLEALSYRDGLTGIFNRRKFNEYLQTVWGLSVRAMSVLSIIMIDIDFFKPFNDHYGHQAGDECLKKVAQVLEATLRRKTDLPARYGGEEFACVLPNTDSEGATKVAELFQSNIKALQIPHQRSKVDPYVTVSQGVATIVPGREQKPEILVSTADEALYISKESGRNRITYLEGLDPSK